MTWMKPFYSTCYEYGLLKGTLTFEEVSQSSNPKESPSLQLILLFLLQPRQILVSVLERHWTKRETIRLLGLIEHLDVYAIFFSITHQHLHQLVFRIYLLNVYFPECVYYLWPVAVSINIMLTQYKVSYIMRLRIVFYHTQTTFISSIVHCIWSWYNSFNSLRGMLTRSHCLEHQRASDQVNTNKHTTLAVEIVILLLIKSRNCRTRTYL